MITEQNAMVSRAHHVERVLFIVLVLNMTVALAKFFYGMQTASASMQADGIHSIIDSLGNLIGIFGIMFAARPADGSHPYGHAKFETAASAVIGIMLVIAAVEVGFNAYEKLVGTGEATVVTPVSFVVMVGTLVVNVLVTRYEHAQAKKLKSDVLGADASHTMSDVLVSSGVIVGLALVALGYQLADAVMAFIVMIAILIAAWGVLRNAFQTLSDHAIIPEEDIVKAAMEIPGVHHVHHVRTRGTQNETYCDLHVHVDPNMTVKDAHELGDRVEDRLKSIYPSLVEVLVHIEPDTQKHA